MSESGTDLRTFVSREINQDIVYGVERGTKRKLDDLSYQEAQGENLETEERIETPSAPKRRRHSKEGLVGKVKRSVVGVFQCEYYNGVFLAKDRIAVYRGWGRAAVKRSFKLHCT